MTQRRLNQWVARLRERAGPGDLGRDRVLSACHRTIRDLRGLNRPASQHDDFQLNGELDADAAAILAQDDALGRIYQALNAPALESAYRATARERRKFTSSEIPTVTQLFTPRWVIEFLLHNTLGRLWRQWHPDSSIEFDWLIDSPADTREACRPLSTLRILDPACGTMNFGLVAAEMLESMYHEEMEHAGRAGWPADASVSRESDIPDAIISSNLIGRDIDPVALELARASLAIKLKINGVCSPRLCTGDSLFESNIESADVVVTNPPYLSARNLEPSRVAKLKRRFPCAWRDEYACFIQRCLELTRPGGRMGLLTMHSFMFTGGFKALRRKLSEEAAIETIAHFGSSLFDVGNPGTLQTVAFTAKKESDTSAPAVAIRLVEEPNASTKRQRLRSAVRDRSQQFRLSQTDLHGLPRGPWAYWTCPALREAWRVMPALGKVAPPRQGLATTNNERFVRYWWEVDGAATNKWRPYAKGGQSRRWYQSPLHRVDWENDGAAIKQSIVDRYPYLKGKWEWVAKNSEYYGREGITYSYLTSGRFSARWMPPGSLFDVAGSALFPDDPLTILGILNSSAARKLLQAINPTVNFQVGDLAQLPVPTNGDDQLRECVRAAMEAQEAIDQFDEITTDFVQPLPWNEARSTHQRLFESLRRAEADIERIVAQRYGLPAEAPDQIPEFDPTDLARRWVSFALKIVLRNACSLTLTRTSVERIRDELVRQCGIDAIGDIERHLGGLDTFLTRNFAGWHNQLYKRRPTILSIRCGSSLHLVSHQRATSDVLKEIMPTPLGWERWIDDGIRINLAPLHESMADAQLRRYLRTVNDDLQAGKLDWSETARHLIKH
jgi:SAM-dependent methyltransferase